jgi:hypothetical protein
MIFLNNACIILSYRKKFDGIFIHTKCENIVIFSKNYVTEIRGYEANFIVSKGLHFKNI